MLKQLLISAALATVAIGASAESKVLWQSEDPAGFTVKWGTAIIISGDDAASVKAGDILKIDVATVNAESGWPQVQLNANVPEEEGGWKFISCVGGLKDGAVASFPIMYDDAALIQKYGMAIQGDGQAITKISVETGTVEIGPNTVWFGPKTWTDWGDGIGISKDVFADLNVGDKLVAMYDTANEKQTLQIILGGWGDGPNVATYQAGDATDFMTIDKEAGTVTIEFIEALSNLTWGDKEYDVFATVKAGGVQIQGVATLNQVLYIPAPLEYPEEMSYTLNGKAELEGVTVTQEYTEGTLSINVTGECDADEVTMEFATPQGWDSMLVLTQLSGDFDYAKKAPIEDGEYSWYPLEYAEAQGLKPGNSFTFPVDGEEQYGMIQLVKDNQVYWATIDITFEVAKAEVAGEPVYPEALEFTLNGKKELEGVQVTQEMDQGSLSINVEGTSTEESITMTFETPEGWTGFIIAAPFADLSEIDFAKTRSEEDWMTLEEALNSPYGFQEANSITFPVDEEGGNFAYLALVKDDRVYNSIIDITFDVTTAGGEVVTDPVFPESLGVTTFAEGLEVEQNNEDGQIFIAVTGEIEESTFDVVLDVPEGWTGFISMVQAGDVTIGDFNAGPRMTRAEEDDWMSIEEAIEFGGEKGNKFTFSANGERNNVWVYLYKDEKVYMVNSITLTANVKKYVDPELAAANQEAYEAVIAQIDALQEKYDAAVAKIKENNPDFDFSEYEEIQNMIDQYREGAAQALASANEEGEAFMFPFDGSEIEGFITMMLMAAEPAPEFPTSLDVTISNNEGVELTIDDSQGIFVINVAGKSSEEELTITVAVPEGFDGFVSMRDIDMDPGIGGGPLTTRAQESEWWPISALLETGAKEGNTMTFPVDGEYHAGQFCLCKNGLADVSNQINVEFEVEFDTTVGVSGVNAAENATFYDLQGNRIAKPAKGMYVKVVNGKATKVAVK